MKLSGFGTLLSSLFTDRLSIYRYEEIENDDGTVGMEQQLVPVYDAKSCRISFSSPDNPQTTKEDKNPIYLQIKVFCGTDIALKKGDKVVAQRIGDDGQIIATYEGTASSPLEFVTHKEFLLVQDGDA